MTAECREHGYRVRAILLAVGSLVVPNRRRVSGCAGCAAAFGEALTFAGWPA